MVKIVNPGIPYPYQGTVFDTDGTTVIEGATVTAYDRQTEKSVSGETDSNGVYIIDLANMGANQSEGDNINLEAVKGNRIKRFATTVLGAGFEDVNFTLEYDDALGAVIDLLNDNWRDENTNLITPIVDHIFNRKELDLNNNDYLLLYEIGETDDSFGIGGSRWQEITGLSIDIRTTKKVTSIIGVRTHLMKIREEVKRILKANIAEPHKPFQLLLPRRVRDLSDKMVGIGRAVLDYDIKYWGV